MMRRSLVLLLALCTCAPAQTTVKRGITGELTFEYEGPELMADPSQDLSAPLLLRLERDGSTYTAWFIGSVQGEYDLRSLIRRRGGSAPGDLQPLPVTVVSNLPEAFATDLYDAADLRVGLSGGYWLTIISLAGLWLAVPVIVVARRVLRPKPVVIEEPEPAPPTLADQLRPLVRAAAAGSLEIADQGKLELLLVHHWRATIAPDAPDVAEAISRIRRHPEAGELLVAVETWLHGSDTRAHDPHRLERLLEPYGRAPAADEADLRPAQEVVAP
jgi:hypothetical protein